MRIAIIGIRGIGSVHARIFHKLGASITGVSSSSELSAANAAMQLEFIYGINTRSYACVKRLLDETKPDAVVIATPPYLHETHLAMCFERNLPVLCEKPLFWPKNNRESVAEKIQEFIQSIRGSTHRLMLNTPNVHFIDAICPGEWPEPIHRFDFEFFTCGEAKGDAIAVDLLPHGVAMLQRLNSSCSSITPCYLNDMSIKSSESQWSCKGKWGDILVCMNFRQNPKGPRHLMFAVNDNCVLRVQNGEGANYSVELHTKHRIIHLKDPFETRSKFFLRLIKRGSEEVWQEVRQLALNNLECCVKALVY